MLVRVIGVLGLLAWAGCNFEPVGSKPDPKLDARADQAAPADGPPVDAAGPELMDAASYDVEPAPPPDAGVDVVADDVLPVDLAPDAPAPPDLAPDVTPEADAGPDLMPEGPLGLLGDPCTANGACLSGVCSDGVCCATACGGVCLSCNLPGSVGLCMVVPVGQDPRAQCPAQAADTCGRAGACDGNGACRRHPDGTTCAPGRTCSGGSCEGVAASGPALWWRLDETAGTTAADASGNGRNGSYGGSPTLPAPSTMVPPVSFANPACRAFGATGRPMIRLAPVPGALKPSGNLTVSVWFRATAALATGSDVINMGGDYFLRLKPDGIEWVKRATVGGTGVYAIARLSAITSHLDGGWHHLAGVTDPAGMRLYLDGVLRASNTRADAILYTVDQLQVGREGNGGTNHDFTGGVDDIRIYTRGLSPTEITALASGAE